MILTIVMTAGWQEEGSLSRDEPLADLAASECRVRRTPVACEVHCNSRDRICGSWIGGAE